MKKLPEENYNDGYYHISKDYLDYPNCWLYVVWSKRGPGKTYGFFYHCIQSRNKFLYLKRTIEDVDFLCMPADEGMDPNPFAPINRDHGTNIQIFKIRKGVAGFWEADDDGNKQGPLLGYVIAFALVSKLKGFNFDMVTEMCFDEFIPQPTEIVRRNSGEALLSIYMTISRDREKRGKRPVKLCMFANAEEISTNETNFLEITDDMAELDQSGQSHKYLKNREIMLHHITQEEIPITEDEKSAIYKGMAGTAWHDYAFGGYFAKNDFSNIRKISLKGYTGFIYIRYKRKDMYIYINNSTGKFHMCSSRCKTTFSYDLDRENDQALFFVRHFLQLNEALINGRMTFEKYSMYDILKNYTKFFKT